jgi:hypothetical protein
MLTSRTSGFGSFGLTVSDLRDPSTWPTRVCGRCDTTLRAPTLRRLAAMNVRHHMIMRGHRLTRCMELHIKRKSIIEREWVEQATQRPWADSDHDVVADMREASEGQWPIDA